jgi:hypothetical protein
MNTICCPPPHATARNAFDSPQFSELRRTGFSARSRAEISLITTDGDKVTLFAASSVRAEHIAYDFLGRVPGQTVGAHAEDLQISTSTTVTAAVQGALDEQELDDIKRLLGVLETSAGDFLSGAPGGLLASLTEIADLGSIASFEAALSYSREASAERTGNAASVSQAVPTSPAGMAVNAPVMAQTEESFLERVTAFAARLEGERLIDTLPRRLTELFKKLAKRLPLDEPEQKMLDRIQSEYFKHS